MHSLLVDALLIVSFLVDLVIFALGRGFLGLPQFEFDLLALQQFCSTCLKCLISAVITSIPFWVLFKVQIFGLIWFASWYILCLFEMVKASLPCLILWFEGCGSSILSGFCYKFRALALFCPWISWIIQFSCCKSTLKELLPKNATRRSWISILFSNLSLKLVSFLFSFLSNLWYRFILAFHV